MGQRLLCWQDGIVPARTLKDDKKGARSFDDRRLDRRDTAAAQTENSF